MQTTYPVAADQADGSHTIACKYSSLKDVELLTSEQLQVGSFKLQKLHAWHKVIGILPDRVPRRKISIQLLLEAKRLAEQAT